MNFKGLRGLRGKKTGKKADSSKSFSLKMRPYWSITVLVIVGTVGFFRYPHSGLSSFYSTAASVIATLYVAVAFGVFTGKEPARSFTFEHGVYMVAGSAGLLASLRGLSVGQVHAVWQIELLTGLTVVGVTAAVLLVGDRLVAWQIGGRGAIAISWTMAFIAIAVTLAIFP